MTEIKRLEELRLEDFLWHIQESIRRVRAYTQELSQQEFLSNTLVQDAVDKNLEVIGEAAHNILRRYAHLVSKVDQIALGNAYKMRNVLIHGYFGVEHATVWDTIQSDLPALKGQIDKMVAERNAPGEKKPFKPTW